MKKIAMCSVKMTFPSGVFVRNFHLVELRLYDLRSSIFLNYTIQEKEQLTEKQLLAKLDFAK